MTSRLQKLRRALIERTLERGGETRERATLGELGIEEKDEYHEYEPSGWRTLSSALRGFEIGPGDGFVDIGCGKGRVLLQATRRPFGRVLGVELSPQLAEQARELVAGDRRRRCGSVEVMVADATSWELPDDVTVAYAYNALSGESLQQMLDRFAESVARAPRRLLFVYANPEHEDEVLSHPGLELLERRGRRRWRADDPRRVSIFTVTGNSRERLV